MKLLIVGLVLLFFIALFRAFRQRSCWSKNVELVVSFCTYEPTWIAEAKEWLPRSTKVTVYSKCAATYPNSTRIDNVGREAHTFLHHIVSRYHSLADVTVFIMDSADSQKFKQMTLKDLLANWCSKTGFYCAKIPLAVHYYLHQEQLATFTMKTYKGSTFQEGQYMAETVPARVRPFGAWFAKYIGGPFPKRYCGSAMMAVSKEVIRRRPIEFYEELLAQTMEGNNIEVGHYLERSWGAIFTNPVL